MQVRKKRPNWRRLATAGDFLATTSHGDNWRPQECRQAPSSDKHVEQSICGGLGL
ncbi:hypothetical protein A2U01_0116579, partial [Trifolium medium]|nr:hypothetical protein [Trifolium medium]